MPRPAITNIPHTAATDHRIPRGRSGSAPVAPLEETNGPGDVPLVDYHWGIMTAEERRDAERDLGMAFALAGRILGASIQVARVPAAQAAPLLEAAVRERPQDLAAGESLGLALGMLGRRDEGLRVYEAVLRQNPGREWTLRSQARALARSGRPEAARAALEKTIAIDPWRSDYYLALAQACEQLGDWPAAISACREALRLNPESFDARSLVVRSYLESHQVEKADAEPRDVLRFYPAVRDVWIERY
jgi:tetratricopeptide (TPR) repeat protein